jgi:CRP-like cAMP-binding protein
MNPTTSQTIAESLKSHPYFQQLSPVALEEIARCVRVRSYDRGALILLESEECSGVYFVQKGFAKILRSSEDGRTQTLSILGPGHPFNEVPAIDGGPNPASVEALTDAVVLVISRADFLHILERHPQVSRAVLTSFAARLRQMVELASDLSLRTVPQRLAKLLLEQAHVAGQMTQHEMAAQLGTVREVVGRALRSLTDEGLVRIDGHRIVITDREGLQRRAGL